MFPRALGTSSPKTFQATDNPVDLSDRTDKNNADLHGDSPSRIRNRISIPELLGQKDAHLVPTPTSEGDRSSENLSSSTLDDIKSPNSEIGFSVAVKTDHSVRFGRYLAFALLFRLVLLAFSVWQDETRWPDGQLRFTDVDYDVFSDAARALVRGEDIYEARPTYRYSPLIAAIVAPGFLFSSSSTKPEKLNTTSSFFEPPLDVSRKHLSHESYSSLSINNQDPIFAKIWGKLVFIFADITCAWLQFEIIRTESLLRDANKLVGTKQVTAVWLICFGWLFNPVTAVVSVRGNAEAVLGVCVLACLLLVLRRCSLLAGLLFGLSVHLKLYPVIYAPAIYLWFTPSTANRSPIPWRERLCLLLPRWSHIRFGLGALFSLGTLTGLGYRYFGGQRFLHQAYLYHFTRVDIKHNFAPHFYVLYLLSGLEWKQSGLAEAGTFANMLTTEHTRAFLNRLQHTIASLVYTSDELMTSNNIIQHFTMIFRLAVRSLLQNEVLLRLLKQSFNLASLLPSVILIPFLAFRLHRSPGLCWFATTYAFVTFNKVCTSQYFLWSLVILPVALASLKLPASVSIRRAVIQSLLIWFGSQAVWLAAAYGLELHTIHSPWFARSVWLLVWIASLLFLLCNVFLLRRLIRWCDPQSCSEVVVEQKMTEGHTKKIQ